MGSEHINQYSFPMHGRLSCNTNATIEDTSLKYYTTFHKSKDTQKEDKTDMLLANGSFGLRIWSAQQLLMIEQDNDNNDSNNEAGQLHNLTHSLYCIEGLVKLMTGINELLSSNVVGCAMSHLII